MPERRSLRWGEWLFRHRDYTPIPLILLVLLWARPDRETLLVGGLVSLAGELFRFWGVASIGPISRTRERAVERLVDTGAFSIVRNPLYLGNFVASLGLVLASGAPRAIFVPLFALFFVVQYGLIVRWEEHVLVEQLGPAYLDYLERVPRWLPAPWLYRHGPHDWLRALRSERPTLTGLIAGYAALVGLHLGLPGRRLVDLLLPGRG